MAKSDRSAVESAMAFFMSSPPPEPTPAPEAAPAPSPEPAVETVKAEAEKKEAPKRESPKKAPKAKKAKEAAPPGSEAGKVKKGFLISEDLDRRINIKAAELGIPKSTLAEQAFEDFLSRR